MKKRQDEDESSKPRYSEDFGGHRAETVVVDFLERHRRLLRSILIGFCILAVIVVIVAVCTR